MRFHRDWAVAVMVAIGLICTGAANAEVDPAMDRLQAVGIALKARNTWSADYQQEYLLPGTTVGEVVSGTVWISWPDKALFATGDPVQRWMGLAGRQVRLLDLEMESCDDHLLTAEEWERIPLVAVLEPDNALARFTIVSEGERGLVLIPREEGGVARVVIEIGEDGLPAKVVVVDSQEATSTFVFTGWEPSPGPPEGHWLPEALEDMPCVGDVE